MAFSIQSWPAEDGTQGLIDILTTALEAHTAWEFVETATETYEYFYEDVETGGGAYIAYPQFTYTIQVWKCLGSANGTGVDFFVSLIRGGQAIVTPDPDSPETTNPTVQPDAYDMGYFMMFGAEEYDSTTHRMKYPIGMAPYGGNPYTVNPDGTLGQDMFYPWLEARWEDQENGVWGSWGRQSQTDSFNGPPGVAGLKSMTSHPMDATSGRTVDFGSLSPSNLPVTGTHSAVLRVSKDGIFLGLRKASSSNAAGVEDYMLYLGAYDDSNVPEGMEVPVPILSVGPATSDWSSSQWNTLAVPRMMGTIETSVYSYYAFGAPNFYNWGYQSSVDTGNIRESFPLPALEAYPVMPWGAVPGSATIRGQYWPAAMYVIPGLWVLSTGGAPSSWVGRVDTMEEESSGHEHLLVLGAGWSSATPYLIDKERD